MRHPAFSILGIVLGGAFLAILAAPADATCPCPKQKQAEMFGSVGVIQTVTSPRLDPPAASAEEIARRRVARGELPPRLPLRLPASTEMTQLDRLRLAGHSH